MGDLEELDAACIDAADISQTAETVVWDGEKFVAE
jgi:hypothetical protein